MICLTFLWFCLVILCRITPFKCSFDFTFWTSVDPVYGPIRRHLVLDGVLLVPELNYNLQHFVNSSLLRFNWIQKSAHQEVTYAVSISSNPPRRPRSLIHTLSVPGSALLPHSPTNFSLHTRCQATSANITIIRTIVTLRFVFWKPSNKSTGIANRIHPISTIVNHTILCPVSLLSRETVEQNPGGNNVDGGLLGSSGQVGVIVCGTVLIITIAGLASTILFRVLRSHRHLKMIGGCCRMRVSGAAKRRPPRPTRLDLAYLGQLCSATTAFSSTEDAGGPRLATDVIANSDIHPQHQADTDDDMHSFITASSKNTHQTGATPIINRRLKDPLHIINEIQIPRTSITLKKIVLEGTFCQMYEAIMIKRPTSRAKSVQKVLIKTLADESTERQAAVVIRDGTLLAGLRHRHLCPLIGACLAQLGAPPTRTMTQPPWLIYPLSLPGNLKVILRRQQALRDGADQNDGCHDDYRCHNSTSEGYTTLMFSTPRITSYSIQILRALKYLHARSIIHRDVASRNCFLAGEERLKLCDSALSRDLFPGDYHCLGDNENRPVKWLSVEALVQRRFSPASDVWAFGVFAWELVTSARLPYSELDPFEMPSLLRAGLRLRQPPNCPDGLWSIIYSCWEADYEQRPSVMQLLRKMKKFQLILSNFV